MGACKMTKRLGKIIFLCILVVLAAVFIQVDKNEFEEKVKSQFSTSDLLADYDYLWETLEAEYLFFPVLEEQNIDIESIKKTTYEQIENMEPDLEQYYRVLDKMFLQMKYFAHLSLIDGHAFQIYQQFYNNQDSQDTGWRQTLQYEQTQHTYNNLLNTEFRIGKNVKLPEITTRYDENRKAVIFKIQSFDANLMERDMNFIQEYLDSLGKPEVEHIVFDITGNVGGSDYYWMNHIVAPFGENVTRTTTLYLKDSELSQKYFGSYDLHPINEYTPFENLPKFVEQLGITHYIVSEDTIYGTEQLSDDVLNAKRWVLIDDRVYSSADSFADFCKSSGWATLVGIGTKGDGIGTTPILVSLPNTGLLVRFSAMAGANEKGQLNVLYGTYPDYYSDFKKKENPLNTVYRLIDTEK